MTRFFLSLITAALGGSLCVVLALRSVDFLRKVFNKGIDYEYEEVAEE